MKNKISKIIMEEYSEDKFNIKRTKVELRLSNLSRWKATFAEIAEIEKVFIMQTYEERKIILDEKLVLMQKVNYLNIRAYIQELINKNDLEYCFKPKIFKPSIFRIEKSLGIIKEIKLQGLHWKELSTAFELEEYDNENIQLMELKKYLNNMFINFNMKFNGKVLKEFIKLFVENLELLEEDIDSRKFSEASVLKGIYKSDNCETILKFTIPFIEKLVIE